MSNNLHDETHRTLMLHAFSKLPLNLQREFLKENGDEASLVSSLKSHNDEHFNRLRSAAGIASDAKPSRAQRVSNLLEEPDVR